MLRKDGDGVSSGSLSSSRTVAALKARAPRRQSRRGRCSGVGEVGTREWAVRRDAGGSARSHRGAGVSRVRERERERAGEAVWRKKSRPALCVATPIFREVSVAMMGLFKVNGVGILWLPGNDEVMAKEVGTVMIVWHGTVTREAFMETR